MATSMDVKNWRKRTKKRLVEAFGGKCSLCSEVYEDEVFDFHHVDPTKKEFSFGSIRSKCKAWQKIIKEIRKCAMLCSNCHRLLHYNHAVLPLDYTRFNEDYAEYEIFKKHPCKVCGKAIALYKTVCNYKCAAKLKGKVDWDNVDVIKLLEKHNYNYTHAGRELDVSDNAVRKRYKKVMAML